MAIKTDVELAAEIVAQLPNNTLGLITPATLRGVLQDMVDSTLRTEIPPPPLIGFTLFPQEMIVKHFFQESVAEGPVVSWQSGGISPVTATATIFPTRLINNGGVKFQKGTKQALTWAVDTDAPWKHRWWVVIARCDSSSNPTATDVPVVVCNGAGGPGGAYRQPYVLFKPSTSQMQSMINDGGFRIEGGACSTLFADWNVIVGYRRGNIVQAVVNGTKTAGQIYGNMTVNAAASTSFMGNINNNGAADTAIDTVMIGQSELDDSQVDRLVGWAMWRVNRQAALPVGHPYKSAPPPSADSGVLLPSKYEFNQTTWDSFVATSGATKYAHRGEAAPAITGYETVFFDDFQTNTVVDDSAGTKSNIWFAPGNSRTIGQSASLQLPATLPTSYVYDNTAHTMALRLLYNSGWKTGSFTSVDFNGKGRWWGKGIFEIRAKFPALASPRPGFFPAFWAYGKEHLYWRTRNRLEFDFFEYDGLDGAYWNSALHVHNAPINYADPTICTTFPTYKINNYSIGVATGFPATIDIYDGQYHTWYIQIEDDFTYFVIDNLETARVPTAQELSVKKYILVDWAYLPADGLATIDPAQTYDMTIDYIKVRQKTTDLAIVPAAFTARPTLSGTPVQGNTLSITQNISAAQIEYLWYRDGVPIVGQIGASYTLTASDVGHKVRAYVTAPSLINQPDAWTAESATIS